MTKQELINRLLALPAVINSAEEAVLDAHSEVIAAKDELQLKEDALILGNAVEGKNAETRAAHMRSMTVLERQALAEAELGLKQSAARLERFKVEFKALRAVALLLQVNV
ncbi:hypothetical protein ACFOQM_05885 [Paenibacillus sp. GCM10012307]|uniref:Uncharacterized protein n=1 Tax=Paenibacillus roseus TaxID=2798579 RepID=A0A934J3I7_9BACL|nr:hypothetical protein [Paenibacillus roseus]MBJ6360828.1 hypothetical protein [Paenibacillus roseus]